jgi:hypothetical protein
VASGISPVRKWCCSSEHRFFSPHPRDVHCCNGGGAGNASFGFRADAVRRGCAPGPRPPLPILQGKTVTGSKDAAQAGLAADFDASCKIRASARRP